VHLLFGLHGNRSNETLFSHNATSAASTLGSSVSIHTHFNKNKQTNREGTRQTKLFKFCIPNGVLGVERVFDGDEK
jgi:hypothetical protein